MKPTTHNRIQAQKPTKKNCGQAPSRPAIVLRPVTNAEREKLRIPSYEYLLP